ncbi:hypothetical protein PPSIR1_39515 [Plesiocystis pacifica SIR-1]|uniref:tRNA(Met) cytidine acetyltransferase TmcA n=1 Tax=Plesiocystis pacifica SIR-1 TaxID=391625 RepID=A6FY33_9BACT|nr:GNAT family N-acetyltransferase [Plesiocystis pacifica]EDM81412.1 hypothetical protein PPSIR1_39515 [Plesiocystis pacifica SIR-1]
MTGPELSERHRRLLVIRDEAGLELVARGIAESLGPRERPGELAWVTAEALPPSLATLPGLRSVPLRELGRWLGGSFDLVGVDARGGLAMDALGQAHGLVRGGGALILDLREHPGARSTRGRHLAAFPHGVEDVGARLAAHVERTLGAAATPLERWLARPPSARLPPDAALTGSAEQAELVARLLALWSSPEPTRAVLLADRGRGKSSALGLALAGRTGQGSLAITAGSERAVVELRRFAGPRAPFVPMLELLAEDAPRFDTIVVDEAAQLPVPFLRRLVLRHPEAHLAFATTTHGYEGTGRGFGLRFLSWLEGRGPVARFELNAPIRWAAGDPVERAVFEALLLDAEPARLEAAPELARLRFEAVDRDALAADRPRLRELFGLLVHAHYRTTPGDLERLLDAPNLELHAGLLDGHVVAATLVAREGSLPPELCEAAAQGKTRLRAHALPDTLVAHLGRTAAGELDMRRSVRIAVHPRLRRRGLATALVEHVHRHAPPSVELFGTLFGATPGLLAFRRSLGYRLVRVSASRGARAGEPSVMMLRPLSDRARALVDGLRRELASELAVQLQLLAADDGLPLEPELVAALSAGLDLPLDDAPPTPAQARRAARGYAHGPRTFESRATALRAYLALPEVQPRLAALEPSLRRVVETRALALRSWSDARAAADLDSLPATMRALRRAFRALVSADAIS